MATNTKKIVNVEILHLDETGYGPQGKHTRRQWRAECLENLLAGKAQFERWQKQVRDTANSSLSSVPFDCIVSYVDGTKSSYFPPSEPISLDFCGEYFTVYLNLADYEFNLAVSFCFTRFLGDVTFADARFHNPVDFRDSNFSSRAWFSRARFEQDTWFEGAQFEGIANFRSVSFDDLVQFSQVIFSQGAYFQQAFFKQSSNFENATFKMVGHFEGARFGEILNFLGVDIASTRLQLPDDLHFTQAANDNESINQISFLKRLSDEHGQWEQALNFNAMELRAKRKLFWQKLKPESHPDAKLLNSHLSWRVWIRFSNLFRGDFWFYVFTLLYEMVADFGRSFTRPLFLLVVLMVTSLTFALVVAIETHPCKAENNCAPIFAQLATAPEYKDSEGKPILALNAYRAAAEYGIFRFANFADFTDKDKNTEAVAMRLFNQPIEPWWARIFGLLKGLIGTVLLFLIGLGLRNRYRVG